jgi:heme/copper-type cytochrome/quinol oxidase subunit 1
MFIPLLILCLLLTGTHVATALPLVKRKGGSGGVRAGAVAASGGGGGSGSLSSSSWKIVLIVFAAIIGAVIAVFIGFKIYKCISRKRAAVEQSQERTAGQAEISPRTSYQTDNTVSSAFYKPSNAEAHEYGPTSSKGINGVAYVFSGMLKHPEKAHAGRS